MARFGKTGPQLRPEPGSRPRPLLQGVPNVPWEEQFRVEIDNVSVVQLDEESVVFIPSMDYREDPVEGDPEATMPIQHSTDMTRVWKTTAVYEQLGGVSHPRIVRFRHRDPWTGFPILEKPTGPALVDFLDKNKPTMYSEATEGGLPRILPRYLPLAYQWALHLVSALSFLHSHSVIFGDLRNETCWLLSPSLSLSLAGFLDAGFLALTSGIRYNGGSVRDEPFHPCHVPRFESVLPTMQTDLFLWGCLVYELITSFWPGDGQGRHRGEIKQMITRREWPALEGEYLGDIVSKGWEYRYENVEELKNDLVEFLGYEGWEVEGDMLRGFRADELFQD